MSHLDIDQLLTPVDTTQPCGQNLEYSAEFLALESLTQGTPEQQFGDTVIAAVAPDWTSIAGQSLAMLAHSKDLRLAVLLTRATTHTHGLPGLASGLELLAGLLAQYWPALHPELEDGDATMRINALSALTSPEALLADLRQAPYLEVRGLPSCRIREAEIILSGRASQEGLELTEADLQRLIGAASEQTTELSSQLERAKRAGRAISELLDEQTPYHGLDFAALQRLLALLQHPLGGNGGSELATVADTPQDDAAPRSTSSEAGAWPTSVRSRQEAARLIELACQYFETHEPGHPAPLLLRRGQRLMTMDFLEIIRELAPDGMGQIEMVTGLNR
ncbi:type VI secretion system protein TssA [Chitinimonas sp.]|uniref:type VI secretion system protein TssA n=1 Tax=Chitinimonas sp. TaxID=1934313 RepID=UPI002F93EA29